ncbi:MAG: hypothetical protein QM736_12155 [Vicinamibacterales bacterium]
MRRRDHQRRVQSGTNSFNGAGWDFVRDTSLNATGFFKPAAGKPQMTAISSAACSADRSSGTALFFGDYEGFRQTRKVTASARSNRGERGRHPLRRRPRPAHRRHLDAGTPIPMTAFARKVLSSLPAPRAPDAEQLHDLQEFTNDTDK